MSDAAIALTRGVLVPFNRRPDIIERLLELPFLPPHEYRHRVGKVARDAAAEIGRLRGAVDIEPGRVDWDRRSIIDRTGKLWQPAPQQWQTLALLLRNAGKTVRYQAIVNELWGDRIDGGPDDAMSQIKVVVSHIRSRVPWPIRNVYKIGYRLEHAP